MKYLFLILITVLIIGFLLTTHVKEGFLNAYCETYNNCTSCSPASGCSWCPKSKVCLDSTTLKSTDKNCNQMNTISSAFRCRSELIDEVPHDSVESNDVLYDFNLYKNKITDKIPPPNLYMNGKIRYSNEDVVSFANNVNDSIQNYQKELPGIVASSVVNNIKPMVKGILSENYYIQGFEDMSEKDRRECVKNTSCSSCVNNQKCGWDPQKLECNSRGPNKSWYITQPPRCVLTSSTMNLMTTQPN